MTFIKTYEHQGRTIRAGVINARSIDDAVRASGIKQGVTRSMTNGRVQHLGVIGTMPAALTEVADAGEKLF